MSSAQLQGFEKHVKQEHNQWAYLFFFIHLDETRPNDYSALELHVHRLVSLSWTIEFIYELVHQAHDLIIVLWLNSWHFEPSQPQRITSGLKQTSICLPFTQVSYLHKSSNHIFPKKHKISPDTNLQITKHTQTSNTKFFKN